jgi:hypothetical protein
MGVSGPKAGERLAQTPSVQVYWMIWASFFPDTEILNL